MTAISIPPPPPRDRRHTRHSPKTVVLARSMYEGGWTPTQIRRYLQRQGIPMPSESTVRRWVIPAEAQAAAQASKLCNRKRRAVRARIVELRSEVRLPVRTIVRVVRHDHGAEASWVDVAAVQRVLAEHEATR